MRKNRINMFVGIVIQVFLPFISNASNTNLIGDFNNDGAVSIAEVQLVINSFLGIITNYAPVANAGTAQNVYLGAVVTLDGSASSDADNDPLTFRWSFTSKPTGSSTILSNATAEKPTFKTDIFGAYTLNLVVNDGKANSTANTVIITVIPDNNISTKTTVPKTGQTSCYDSAGTIIPCAGTGQDGELQVGVMWPIPRFADNGNGTMTDGLTGLIWSKDAYPASERMNWQGALDYIKIINSNKYMGYSDWRLPNVNELKSLQSYGEIRIGDMFIYTWLNGFKNVLTTYWSSSTYAGNTLDAWIVDVGGRVYDSRKTDIWFHSVWPVRGSQSGSTDTATVFKTGQNNCYNAGGETILCSGTGQDGELQSGASIQEPRFVAASNQTISDTATGLVWSNDLTLLLTTWQGALDYIKMINKSTYLGYSDWRLPNVKELGTLLINYGKKNTESWLWGEGFKWVPIADYWSSSTDSTYFNSQAWTVFMNDGSIGAGNKLSGNYVWPVRGGR